MSGWSWLLNPLVIQVMRLPVRRRSSQAGAWRKPNAWARAPSNCLSTITLIRQLHPEIESFTKNIADECDKQDLVLMLEPLSYSLDENKKLSSEEKRYVVVETAKRLTPLGADILKAEFPLDVTESDQSVWADACAEISAASTIPWILLSAAVDYEVFLQQVMVACNAGASGIAVGRAVWKEAVMMDW